MNRFFQHLYAQISAAISGEKSTLKGSKQYFYTSQQKTFMNTFREFVKRNINLALNITASTWTDSSHKSLQQSGDEMSK